MEKHTENKKKRTRVHDKEDQEMESTSTVEQTSNSTIVKES